MNPFEEGVTAALGLHAVLTRALADRVERTVQGMAYRFFYNPMWGFWGDRSAGPAGTYYHRSSSVGELFWHMFDQVLLRPDLMHKVHDLMIVDCIQGEHLVSGPSSLPRAADYSDHLPLVFRLDLD
ncbi:MAG TPA: hypothetical protein VMG10_06920 [Gemmataceae bacterium]|nr:hypothetical protein [Gemmataceae bacterium]